MFLLVLAPPTFNLRLAPPHRPTLSSVTQMMEPLIFGNLTSPNLASNIRSGDLRVTASIAQIYKPCVLLRYVFLDSNFSMFSFFYKSLMAPLLSIFMLLVFVLHVASESTREVVEQIDGEEFTEDLLFRPLPDQKALSDFHFETIPSGPSFRDFVVWKGETATPTPAPAWSTDSGKIARHTSLRSPCHHLFKLKMVLHGHHLSRLCHIVGALLCIMSKAPIQKFADYVGS
ncbi:unnamed protein product [Lactuca saligna]|uniref:Uncharacterized protein n=1 Tax=Lactuca saligna TaxID=75948 RepID=A0AA36E600_LACSI|nr:unnamed protein product [Lactuca saligna]